MDKDKQLEIIRKRNIELTEEIEGLKKLLLEKDEAIKDSEKTVAELHRIKAEWETIIADLKEQKEKYVRLNKKAENMKSELLGIVEQSGVSVPWYKKIKYKI